MNLRYFLLLSMMLQTLTSAAQTQKLLIGTYTTKGNSQGIYIYDFDVKTGEAKPVSIIKNVNNPSYLTVSKNKQFIYTIQETGASSAVSAFHFNNKTGETSLINKEVTNGADPCFVLADDKHVFTANYSGGSVNVLGIKEDGALTPVKQSLQHTGSGPAKNQKSAHVHQVQFSPDHKYVLATDLGDDHVYIYSYSADSAQPLSLKTKIKTNAGSGPRHLTFSPNGKYVYLTHEFNGKISVFNYHDGNLSLLQEIATAAADFSGKIDGADIHISADGKFLYQTNRGDANAIAVFAVQRDGKLKHVTTQSTKGKGPRNFVIDPSGNYVLVAHQYTNDVVVFKRNAKTGKLVDSGKRIQVGTPVCLVFVE